MVGDNQSDWLRLEELFHEAADLSPAEQAAFLDDRCGNDAVLRAELFALLAESSLGTTKFRSAVAATARGLAEDRDREWIGRRVGPWRVERPISQGGMGQVYEVERADGAYTQRAALKAIRWEIDTPEARRAFAEERQILARLEHPNVARLLDGGETIGGRPYLVLEFVEGTPITEYVQAKKLSIEERLRLMITVCKAVHAAHKSLIIHQDLKPENILVAEDGTPKLLDFGIAKLLDAGTGNDSGTLRFSPAYASPEQGRGEPVSTATDVFSLGAILFELLTDKPPRKVTSITAFQSLSAICSETLPPPSTCATNPQLRRKLRGDLDTVVQTATTPEPSKRYQSAEQLAEDLHRYLNNFPLLARPHTFFYISAKHLRRHWLPVALASLAASALIAAVIVSQIQARKADRRFNEVRKLANTFLFDFHDQVRDLQGSTKARESVASTALTYLRSLSAEAHGDRGLELEVASAYDKVAAVQFEAGLASLGRPRDARESLLKAAAIRDKWIRHEPLNAELHEAQSNTYLKLARVESGLSGLDKKGVAHDKGIAHGERALALSKRPSESLLLTTAKLHQAKALLASRSIDLGGAIQHYTSALHILQKLFAKTGSPESTLAVQECRLHLGLSYYNASRGPEAIEQFRLAESGLQELRARHPENRRYRTVLLNLYYTYGGVLKNPLLETYDLGAAAALFRKSTDLARESALDGDDLNAQRQLAASYCQYGSAMVEREPVRARQAFQTGIGMLKSLSERSPNDKSLERTLALHLIGYASALALQNPRLAVAEGSRGMKILNSLAASDPKSIQAQRMRLGYSIPFALVQLSAGDPNGALRSLTQVEQVAGGGSLQTISQSLLMERIQFFSALAQVRSALGQKKEADACRSKFDQAAAESRRRNLRGPLVHTETQQLARAFTGP